MLVRLLGTAAGGGFPQWNCNCSNCRGLRAGELMAKARTQSCVAVSADGERWFLLNASPDLRTQLEGFPPLWPPASCRRGTPIEAILLTDADLDHTLGLLLLRERSALTIYAPAAVQQALRQGLALPQLLAHYCCVEWREPVEELAPLPTAAGHESGLLYQAIPLTGKPPRYLAEARTLATGSPFRVGYYLMDVRTGGRLLFLPGLARQEEQLQPYLRACDAILLDGTFWSEYELQEQGLVQATASSMGHLPISGPAGSLAWLTQLPIPYRIYTHINNTNPILVEDSPQHATVHAAGVIIGWDGLELQL
ncbi:MAG: pyrroloquinoline quinone biosynthesis protein PqqB [Thermogemmatispora sp.]|uniref:pyrroloquinoline quinone biosynthesis protein PqqB n=1 Tax=Thermogemmatispora sp. TaxID=1968838 RepID=UPI0019EAFD3C|nr:pyrroloquinoline quinone biosynthesis protein PqqB [Thermogemmatispora sp.]MBE3566733.1 pyrroloquinoline quinone biosynthesis protein PqqB [Thermogemmatispora sp.]